MIAASGILVVVAFITLILGVFRNGLSMIWTSIAASVLAAIFLALGVVQGNKRRVATAGPASPMPSWGEQPSTAVAQRESFTDVEPAPPPSLTVVPEPEPETAVIGFEAPAPKPAPARTRSAAPKKAAARKPATAASAATVVVIPDRDKYHKDTCRYAKNAAAMTMTKVAARREGYKPCATCKP